MERRRFTVLAIGLAALAADALRPSHPGFAAGFARTAEECSEQFGGNPRKLEPWEARVQTRHLGFEVRYECETPVLDSKCEELDQFAPVFNINDGKCMVW